MANINTDTISVKKYPPPWVLTGSGYILLYKFPKYFALEKGFIPAFLRKSFAGGLGAVMIIDYAKSNAGPYGELLFIPGKFLFRGKKLSCITKIYVSTRESIINGWENWAIPKEQADFIFSVLENKRRGKVVVTKDTEPVIQVSLKNSRISFPIHTKLLPFPLVQEKDGKLYYTNFSGKGWARFTRIEDMRINPELFPDVVAYRPLMIMRIDNFVVTFPPSEIRTIA
jgi:hypothetical protein